MPRKLTIIGVLAALVLGVVGLAQTASAGPPGPSPLVDAQSFCTVGSGTAGTCPAGFSPINWDACYDISGGTQPSPNCANDATESDSSIPVGTGVPIKSWTTITLPIGSRLTLPVTYTPTTFGAAGGIPTTLSVVTGDVTARTEILCDGTQDVLARNKTAITGGAAFDSGKDPDSNPAPLGGVGVWPGNGWDNYNFYRDTPSDPNYAYIPLIQPMPASFTTNSIDVARLVKIWLGGAVGLDIPPEPVPEGVSDPNIQGTPLVILDTTSPYAPVRANVAILGGNPNPPNNGFLCLDSPQDSVAANLELIPPSTPGNYVRWTNLQSAADSVSAQVTRLMIVRCLKVGGAAGTCDLADSDGDGVPNAVEAVLGTDPAMLDTDADGSSDFTENFEFTDPGCAGGVPDNHTCGAGHPADTRDTDGDTSWDLPDDLSGLACGTNGGPAVGGACTVANNGDLPASGAGSDDNCPVDANPSQLNTDSLFDKTNSPNTPDGGIYRGDSTNPHQDNQGDACDRDADNDGLDNVVEAGFLHTNLAPGSIGGPTAGTLWCLAQGSTAPSGGMSTVSTDPLNPDDDSDGGLDGRECQFGSDPKGAGASSCNPSCSGLNRYPAAGAGADADGDLLFPAAAELFYRTSHLNQGTTATNTCQVPANTAGAACDDLEQGPSGVNTYNCPPATTSCTAIPDTKVGPSDNDSDGDLLNDGVEVKWYDTSPSAFDTDGDGCSDGREAADNNGDHKVNATDSLAIGQHASAGSLAPGGSHPAPLGAPSGPYNSSGVRRDELATYDVNKDGAINATDQLLAGKLTGSCKFSVGTNLAQGSTTIVTGTKP